jgi:hypothetical protein
MRLFSKRVTFNDGSYVEWANVEAIRYVDACGRVMDIPWVFAHRFRRGRILKVTDLASWDSPHRNESVSPDERTEIISKISEYCRRRRIPLEIC